MIRLARLGLQYGPQFQTIRQIHSGEGEVLVKLQTDGDLLGYVIPPMLMDGAFQSLAVGLLQDADSSFYLPVGMERLECFSSVSGEVWSHAQWRDTEGDVRTADLTLFDDAGIVARANRKTETAAGSPRRAPAIGGLRTRTPDLLAALAARDVGGRQR